MSARETDPREAWLELQAADPIGRSLEGAAETPQAQAAFERIVSGVRRPSIPSRSRPAAAAALVVRAGRSRTLRVATGAVGAAALASVIALLVVAAPSGAPAPASSASLRPDPASLGTLRACASPAPALRIACVDGAEAARRSDPAVAGDAWIYRADDARLSRLATSPRKPSLVFPPGTTYGQALDGLVVSVTLTGRLPAGTTLGPPLPDGTVLLRTRDASRGIAIDLRAPFGYAGRAGTVYTASFVGVGRPDTGGTVWPVGSRVAVPTLPACQIAASRTARPLRCTARDDVSIRGLDRSIAPLPPVTLAAAPREEAPDLDLPVVSGPGSGTHLRLSSLRGRVVLLTAFASWCEPCVRSTTAVASLAARYAGRDDVAVVGLDVSDLAGSARRFIHRHGLGYTVIRAPGDEAAHLVNPYRELGAPRSAVLPVTYLIDRHGLIARRLPGTVDESRIASEVERLLHEAP
jgi:cytochrome c biogenesis protein CcmG, thiol:disulfide interchange protein DsbE